MSAIPTTMADTRRPDWSPPLAECRGVVVRPSVATQGGVSSSGSHPGPVHRTYPLPHPSPLPDERDAA